MTKLSAKVFKRELKQRILPFWRNLRDPQYGGFFGYVHHDLTIKKHSDKHAIATARLLWGFSAAYKTLGIKEDLIMAEHAYDFLVNELYDKTSGGFFAQVTYKGGLVSTMKHTVFQAYVLYGLSEYYSITNNQEALLHAKRLFYLIEEKAFSEKDNKYIEALDGSWTPSDKNIMARKDLAFDRTGVCYLHLLEGYTNLYRIWPDASLKIKIQWLLDLFDQKIYNPDTKGFGIYFDKNWKQVSDSVSYGRDIESSWLIQDAMTTIGYENDHLRSKLFEVVYNTSEVALQEDGSFYIGMEQGLVDKHLWWYAHTEAIIGFFNAYEMSGEKMYYEMSKKVWHRTEKLFIDARKNSEWLACINPDGSIRTEEAMVTEWKTFYHTGRFCCEMIKRLNRN